MGLYGRPNTHQPKLRMSLGWPDCGRKDRPVILRCAQDLAADRDRPFAEFTLERSEGLRVTRYDGSNGQEPFVQIEPCLRKFENGD